MNTSIDRHACSRAAPAELERQLIGAYLAGAGHDFHTLATRDDAGARKLLADASRYASEKLSGIEHVRTTCGSCTASRDGRS
jgi:hypothetical protein